jgi:AcrR family transcriptional regulator
MSSTERPMRADARRNREAIIAVAKVHVGRNGVGTSLEAIAREAGVSQGTMYRHFPERGNLLAAILDAENDRIEATAEHCRSIPGDARDRLDAWLQAVEDYCATYQGLAAPLVHALDAAHPTALSAACDLLADLTGEFLGHAQSSGLVRAEVSASDFIHCCAMLAWLRSVTPEGSPEPTSARAILQHGYVREAR